MQKYDIILGWTSYVDRPFAELLKARAGEKGLSFQEITLSNFEDSYKKVLDGSLSCNFLIAAQSIPPLSFLWRRASKTQARES